MLPQVHSGFHIDEAGVFAKLPVRVVGDPPLPVISVDHFPAGREDGEGTVATECDTDSVHPSIERRFACMYRVVPGLLEEAGFQLDVVLVVTLSADSLQVFDALLLGGRHLQVPLLQMPAGPQQNFL